MFLRVNFVVLATWKNKKIKWILIILYNLTIIGMSCTGYDLFLKGVLEV